MAKHMMLGCSSYVRIVTGDESWCYGYDPESKQASSQWKTPNSPRPKKAHQVRSNVKTMLICFFDVNGIVHKEFILPGQTVNQHFYLDVSSKEGREQFENESRERRPWTSITEEYINAIRVLVESNRHLTVSEIASQVGLCYGSLSSHHHKGARPPSNVRQWVPRLLTEEQKLPSPQVSERHSARFADEDDAVFNRIITCDETWVHHYTPESKQASKEWQKKSKGTL
ncbi:hypothetical protein ANN_14672 [Periplaneta americana]|uniref:Mariner Mos1 transposase n=1 Tax=Periplaneta americana TaxID=6978 RepID=A0ABQ8SYF0_PERAM|nr:hypothetical protein ANN_14672 [Periplaneta americana]